MGRPHCMVLQNIKNYNAVALSSWKMFNNLFVVGLDNKILKLWGCLESTFFLILSTTNSLNENPQIGVITVARTVEVAIWKTA